VGGNGTTLVLTYIKAIGQLQAPADLIQRRHLNMYSGGR